jgi:DeoR/GlpR family transcriptional regulator of sugar metabolism
MAPMKDSREFAILDVLREERAATVSRLAATLQASEATIRRDLVRLDKSGLVRRTHGGAVLIEADAPFAEVENVNRDAKNAIAITAAAQISDGESIILDIGTTTLQLATLLHGRRVTVITASIAVFDELRDDRDVQLILLPGDYDRVYRCVGGHLTPDALRQLHADHAFLGTSGIAENGDLRDTTMVQIPIKRAMLEASDRATVLADSSKFPGTGAGRIRPTTSLTQLITERAPSTPITEALEAHGVTVTIA